MDPKTVSLASITALVEEANAAELAVAEAEESLQREKEKLRDIVERRLPEMMDAVGMKKGVFNGLKIEVADEMQVKQPPVAQRAAAHDWLRKNNLAGLIKNTVEVSFGVGQEDDALKFVKELNDESRSARRVEEVNSTTLKAHLQRALAAGESPPLELFGARAYRVAKIKK